VSNERRISQRTEILTISLAPLQNLLQGCQEYKPVQNVPYARFFPRAGLRDFDCERFAVDTARLRRTFLGALVVMAATEPRVEPIVRATLARRPSCFVTILLALPILFIYPLSELNYPQN
jgi:hypothetical protein